MVPDRRHRPEMFRPGSLGAVGYCPIYEPTGQATFGPSVRAPIPVLQNNRLIAIPA